MGEFRMPALGAEMTEGKLVEWLVRPGDTVHRGDVIAVVETDKAELEVEVWEDGVFIETLVPLGQKVPVGTPLARLGDLVGAGGGPATITEPAPSETGAPSEGERAPLVVPDEPAPAPAPAEPPATAPVPVGPGGGWADRAAGTDGEPPAIHGPLARHRAEELGVDLTGITGTGPGGSITRRDVEEAASRPAAVPVSRPTADVSRPAATRASRPRVSPYARRLANERGVDPAGLVGSGPGGAVVAHDLEGAAPPGPDAPRPAEAASATTSERGGADTMRLAIARAMDRANREIPHYHLGLRADLTVARDWLEEHNAERPAAERILPAALQLKAVALALREHPELNGFWIEDGFRPADAIDVGVAIALRGGGLIAPAIPATDTLGLDVVMERLRDLVRRVRAGRLRASEAAGASVTVTSLGDLGVETVHGVITPPQVALVGIGRPVDRPWVVDGAIAVRNVVHLTLAADHRQTDGAVGSRFLTTLADLLQRPEDL